MSTPVSRIAQFVVGALMLGALSSCATEAQIGELRSVDGGTQIIVPALWADAKSEASGIEPATVWVDPNRTSDQLAYEVNLSDVQAKGGGAQWQAATSTAAAIGTLFSGRDPDDVACKFDITGPIDGPSAGGVLTVGVLAALNQHALLPSVTMTGTISPDGSIGPVGLIPFKLKAAAEAGFETVLLPAAVTTMQNPASGESMNIVDYASDLDIQVKFVRTLDEAYEHFTGEPLSSEGEASPFSFANFTQLDSARTQAATMLHAEVTRRLQKSPDAPADVRDQLQKSQQAISDGDVNTAFALAVDALNLLENWRGSTEFEQRVTETGLQQSRMQLREQVSVMLDEVNEQLTEAMQDTPNFDVAQSLSFPGAIAWLTYARAIFVSLQDSLESSELEQQPAILVAYAGLASQVHAETETVFPATQLLIDALPASSLPSAPPVADFLSGYTNFLVAAGDANLTYLRDVANLTEDQQRQLPVTELVPVAFALADETDDIDPGLQSIDAELEQSSVAMTYFVVTTSLVTAAQVFGSSDMWLDPEQARAGANEYVADSITHSYELTANSADQLLSAGMNAGFPLWSAEWGTAAFAALSSQDRDATGTSIALNELWYDAITVLSMRAYVSTE